MFNFKTTRKVNLDIYYKNNLIDQFNNNNINTFKNIETIQTLLKKDIFEVPFFEKKFVWGKEIIFFPFTNKVFKIIKTSINDTSIQLHPRKNEYWYTLNDTKIYNGNIWIDVQKNQKIIIPKNTIHCMKKGSIVFEVQDNTLYDKHETIRIFDINNRKILNKYEYLNYILPHNKNEITITNIENKIDNLYDVFLFSINCQIEDIALEKEKLYYVKSKLIKKQKVKGKFIIIPAEFITLNIIDDITN